MFAARIAGDSIRRGAGAAPLDAVAEVADFAAAPDRRAGRACGEAPAFVVAPARVVAPGLPALPARVLAPARVVAPARVIAPVRVAGPGLDAAGGFVAAAVLRRGDFVTPSLVSTLRREVFIRDASGSPW
ncbi:MAG TPA: hypothetical protein VGR63_00645 [Casimicrobiaceae bacterium]|nr:hypothetical protein [Casimicrobiaceae bacterium]